MARFADLRAQVKAEKRRETISPEEKGIRALLLPSMFVAMADGALEQSELDAIAEGLPFLGATGVLTPILRTLHDDIQHGDPAELIADAAERLADSARETAIELALRVAMADGEFDVEEQGTLRAIAKNFGIGMGEYAALVTRITEEQEAGNHG